jgi:polar amino acid transport system substrate-binding protein
VTLLTVGYGDRVPRSGSGRSFSIGWMLFGMLLVAAVTATFTANLTVHRLNTTISTPDDLRDHSTVTVKDSIAALAMKERHIPVTEVATTDEMVAAVRNGTAEAAVYEAPVLARAVHESEGNLALAGPQFTHSFDAFAVPLGNDQRQAINLALLAMLGDGAYDHIYRSWFAT